MTRDASGAGRPRRFRGDRGATIVEAAFVTPVFFLLVFGIMEFGWLYKDWMSVSNASHDGAREGSAAGVDAYADYDILFVVQRSLAALSKNVDYIIVFKATGPNMPVPGACKTAAAGGGRGVPGSCNVYYPADWNAPSYGQASFGYDAVANPNPALLDVNWPGLSRSDHKTDPGPDWLGVFVQATHDSLTGISAGNQVLTRTSVIQIEATRK